MAGWWQFVTKQSFWYKNIWRSVNYSPQTDLVSDFTEIHSLNVINVKQYPVLSALSAKFRSLASKTKACKVGNLLSLLPSVNCSCLRWGDSPGDKLTWSCDLFLQYTCQPRLPRSLNSFSEAYDAIRPVAPITPTINPGLWQAQTAPWRFPITGECWELGTFLISYLM
jgi:hypothetical protein